MQRHQIFTLDEARALLPTLKEHLVQANVEMAEQLELVKAANEFFEESESAMSASTEGDQAKIRTARANFEKGIEGLSKAQGAYVERLNYWVEKIISYGVILRDLREGLLDFPAQHGDFDYLLCWRMDDEELGFWHDANDGYRGRKPLAALQEYF